jgi:hypothetical protein
MIAALAGLSFAVASPTFAEISDSPAIVSRDQSIDLEDLKAGSVKLAAFKNSLLSLQADLVTQFFLDTCVVIFHVGSRKKTLSLMLKVESKMN